MSWLEGIRSPYSGFKHRDPETHFYGHSYKYEMLLLLVSQ